MSKITLNVKDASGAVQGMGYENSLGNALLQQVVHIGTVDSSALGLAKSEDAPHVSGDVGVMSLGVRTDTPTTSASATNDYEPFHTNNVGAVWVTPTPSTIGGSVVTPYLSAASTNATLIKTGASTLLALWVSNTSSSVRYVKLYNKATVPVVGTDVPVIILAVPANYIGDLNIGTYGIAFSLGMGFGIVGGAPNNDTTAVGLNDVCLNVIYK